MGTKKDKFEGDIPNSLVQIFSWLALITMYTTDKLLHIPEPPLPERWYAVVFGIATASKINNMYKKHFGNKKG